MVKKLKEFFDYENNI